jgi:type II secretory pathway pseudopilin PulG
MLKYFKITNEKGVTFVELMVVMAFIFIMAATLWIVDPRPAKNLEIAARQLANDLRRAQNMAMAAETRTAGGEEYVPCGYGLSYGLASTSYVLVESFDDPPPDVTCPGTSLATIEEIGLPTGIEMATTGESLFLTPDGRRSPAATTTIPVRRTDDPTYFKNVIITGDGSIEVD